MTGEGTGALLLQAGHVPVGRRHCLRQHEVLCYRACLSPPRRGGGGQSFAHWVICAGTLRGSRLLGHLCGDPAWLSPLGPSVWGPCMTLASWAICVGILRGSRLLATVSNARASASISLRLRSFIPLAVIPGVKCLILC